MEKNLTFRFTPEHPGHAAQGINTAMTMPSKIWALRYEKEIETCGGKALLIDTEWLTGPCGSAQPYIRSDIAEELARAALQVIENYGFTSDGNDRYREVDTDHITELENALARYRALTP